MAEIRSPEALAALRAELQKARAKKTRWKILVRRYRMSRQRLWEIMTGRQARTVRTKIL
jgi:hypothetical protein